MSATEPGAPFLGGPRALDYDSVACKNLYDDDDEDDNKVVVDDDDDDNDDDDDDGDDIMMMMTSTTTMMMIAMVMTMMMMMVLLLYSEFVNSHSTVFFLCYKRLRYIKYTNDNKHNPVFYNTKIELAKIERVYSFLVLLLLARQHARHKHLHVNLITITTKVTIATRKAMTSSK